MKHNYIISTQTLNGVADAYALEKEILASSIEVALEYIKITVTVDDLEIMFKAVLSAAQITVLTGIINTHDGVKIVEPDLVDVDSSPAFANKKLLVNGVQKSLFKRVHGASVSIPANSTGYLELIVPYPTCKFSGAEIFGGSLGDSLDFFILDTATNTYSGAPIEYPNWLLNQFGFDVQIPGSEYQNTSNYDADLYHSMVISCAYKNNDPDNAKVISGNFWLHEVK